MTKRIFVLSRESMFSKGIEFLLSEQCDLEILHPADLGQAVECIQYNRPEVVIVNCDEPDCDLMPAVLCILRERLGTCVISISLKDNEICAYRGEQKEIHHVDDLLMMIQE